MGQTVSTVTDGQEKDNLLSVLRHRTDIYSLEYVRVLLSDKLDK